VARDGDPVEVKCQIFDLQEAGQDLSGAERAWLRLKGRLRYFVLAASKVAADPGLLWTKARRVRDRGHGGTASGARSLERRSGIVLDLRPGERVRVKSSKEILASLDQSDRLEGMSFMASVMEPYCGRVFTVRKRVDRFFDEKHWKLRKLKHVVILDQVFCEPARGSHEDFAGCERTCFLFWKEAWLERVEEGAGTAPTDPPA